MAIFIDNIGKSENLTRMKPVPATARPVLIDR